MDKPAGVGARLGGLRPAAGFGQIERADALDITQRINSHYEGQADPPPSALTPKLARIFGISVEEQLSVKPIKPNRKPDPRMLWRLNPVERLPPTAKRQLGRFIGAFIERETLKQQIS